MKRRQLRVDTSERHDVFPQLRATLAASTSRPEDAVKVLLIRRAGFESLPDALEMVALAHAITKLGSVLSLQVVAEGVERLQQVLEVRTLGWQFAQGFYFARPLEVESVERLLQKGNLCIPGHAA